MARFIVVPKADAAIASLNLTDVRFTPEARAGQVDTLLQRRRTVDAALEGSSVSMVLERTGLRSAIPDAPGALPLTGIAVIEGDPGQLEQLRAALPNFDVIEDAPLTLVRPFKTGKLVSDTNELDRWHLEATKIMRARESGFSGRGEGVGVAVLDTGVEEVAEISGRVVSAFELDRTTGNAIAITTRDTEGHGTHVAGLVAGQNVGVAPAANLMNVIMIPNGFGNLSDFIFAIEFVATRPEISILNMSAGIRGLNVGMKQAAATAIAVGILPVMAIGNEGANTSRSPGNYAEVMAIGASTKQDKVASFSGGGTMIVDGQSYTIPDLVAPGQEVTSCIMGGGYEAWNGTSMATPIVSGIAALIVERFPMITEPDLRAEIMAALRLLPGESAQRQGEGLAQLPTNLWFTSS